MKRVHAIIIAVLIFILALIIIDPSIFTWLTGKASLNEIVQCTDSDGKDAFLTSGFVTLTYTNGTIAQYQDYCSGSETVDYFCSNLKTDNPVEKTQASPAGCICQNGACIKPSICTENQCNPSNSEQICINNTWKNCPAEQICSLNACISPLSESPSGQTVISSSGGGGSSSSETSSSSTSTAAAATTRSIGELSDSSMQDIEKNELILFTINNVQHSFIITELTDTDASLNVDSSATFTLSVGNDKQIALTPDGASKLDIKLKSINIATKIARLLITIS